MSKQDKFLSKKYCPCCGIVYLHAPDHAQFQNSRDELCGYYWTCVCGTPIFIPQAYREKEKAAA